MKNLQVHSETTPLLPSLRYLKINITNGIIELDDASVVDMVQSRWIPDARSLFEAEDATSLHVACLREFTMMFHSRNRVLGDVYKRFEKLERDGLRVVVKVVTGEKGSSNN